MARLHWRTFRARLFGTRSHLAGAAGALFSSLCFAWLHLPNFSLLELSRFCFPIPFW
jgi:membrane protease YdiL (CAAX protease family)